jgi:NAD(P)-dependent dehydrogenase (short-subunit alcohol dehydrogenase family)
MADRMKGKVAVITGAACGIGAGTAKLFAEEGASVIISDLDVDAGQALSEELGDSARFIRTDVSQEDDVAAAVDLAVSEFGRLDCIVNNAGIVGAVGSISETSVKLWDTTIAVLLRGVFLGMKHASRVMIPQKSGSILSLSSTAGVAGGLGPHAYTAAKHAVVGLTKSVGSELAKHGIRVNAVAPGNIVTEMTSAVITGDPTNKKETAERIDSTSPLGFAGYPIDIANALLYLASDEARYVSGHTLVVDAGQTTSGEAGELFHGQEADIIREAGKRGL